MHDNKKRIFAIRLFSNEASELMHQRVYAVTATSCAQARELFLEQMKSDVFDDYVKLWARVLFVSSTANYGIFKECPGLYADEVITRAEYETWKARATAQSLLYPPAYVQFHIGTTA